MTSVEALKIFFIIFIVGIVFELLYFDVVKRLFGRRIKTSHKFSLGKNISLMAIPILGVIALVVYKQYNYVSLFIWGAIIGTLGEYSFGRFFDHIDGKKIWTYHYGAIGGYTSFFSIPYWGLAAMVMMTLSQLVGFK